MTLPADTRQADTGTADTRADARLPPGSSDASPWHEGERRLQEALGVRDKMETLGRQIIRSWMPDQHRTFFGDLPFVLVGAVDDAAPEGPTPWASIVVGRRGFVGSPDPRTVTIAASLSQDDPARAGLTLGAPVGLLGIELATRRRNRVNGRVVEAGSGALTLAVEHSFGNCPQYIQTRDLERAQGAAAVPGAVETSDALTETQAAFIARADAFFVASFADPEGDAARRQVDVSHRGGKAGFVRVGPDGALTIPDFAGNLFFNTLGNILTTGRAGLLFVDFETGDVLQLTGAATVDLDSPEIAAFQGAERLWTVRPTRIVLRRQAIPLRGAVTEWSPNALMTGDWDEAAARLAADAKRREWRPFRVASIVDEARDIRSFELTPDDGGGLAPFQAGQHLPIRLHIDGAAVTRTYTLSTAPSDGRYRISVRRDGRASSHLHDAVTIGDRIETQAPQGGFTIDAAEARPVVMLSAGVGITPMLSMLRHVVYEGARTRGTRPVWFLHGARSLAERPFRAELASLVAAAGGAVRALSALSAPEREARPGVDYEAAGRLSVDVLKQVLPFDDYDFYLCGPGPFMQALYEGLRDLGVRDARIFAEAFGTSGLKRRPDADAQPQGPAAADGPTPVIFSASGKEATWTPAGGTLLEVAEARGLTPAFGCRSGTCGSCRTRIVEGAAAYEQPPSFHVPEGEVLICCARPAAPGEGETGRLILDL